MTTDEGAGTPLIYSSRKGRINNVRCLLANGANVNATNQAGETALMNAAMLGYTDIARLLLDRGANPNAATKTGETALSEAAVCTAESDIDGCPEMIRLLIGRGSNKNLALLRAAQSSEHAPLQPLIHFAKSDINAVDKFSGNTALMSAVISGYSGNVALLLDLGANVNATNHAGETALSLAKKIGRAEIIDMLRDTGAKK